MKRYISHLPVALSTFLVGAVASDLTHYIRSPGSEANMVVAASPEMPQVSVISEAGVALRKLSPEEWRIIREAESFVCSNGYTEYHCGSAGKVHIEPGEGHDDLDEIFARRRDTLEPKAYGLVCKRRGGSTFWTVVFRYTEHAGKNREMVGRAFTVEENRFNSYLISFSRNFPLAKVEKRL